MRKEKKLKTRKHEKKNIYIIGTILVVFLGIILFLNARSAFRKMETRDCIKNMVLMEEAMLQMRKEFRLDVPRSISFDELARVMAYYYHFGEVVFENPTTGTLRLKDEEGLDNLPLSNRQARYILDVPKCPSKGKYTLIPSRKYPGLFDIYCSVHGNLYLPNEEKKYSFTGDIDALNPHKTALGREADIYFSKEENTKEFITIVPFTEATPTPTPTATPKGEAGETGTP